MRTKDSINFWQYFKLNRVIGIYCLKVCTFLFTTIGILIALGLYISKGIDEDPMTVIIGSALFGYCFAIFIFGLAIFSAYQKATRVYKVFHQLPEKVIQDESLMVGISTNPNLDPRHYFIELAIVKEKNGELELVSEAEIKNWL